MTKREKKLKVAIVTDWLTNMAGAERVVLELHRMFPNAPIFTSLYDAEKMPLFEDADIRTSFIQKIPFAKKKHQLWTVLRWRYFSKLDLSDYDLVLSASGAEAKAVMGSRGQMGKKPKHAKGPLHINYCHSPTHYYWVRPDEYIKNPGFGKYLDPIMRFGLKRFLKRARAWDYLAAQQPDVMVANSTVTKQRIAQYYDRKDAPVVFPPVDLNRFKRPSHSPKREGFVTVGRQVHYMRRDLAVLACTRLNLPLKVIGRGPENEKLRNIAGPNVQFLTSADDAEVARHLRSSKGFIFPGVEDFGIVATEAMASGTPVIAYRAGGALDQVVDGQTGLFFDRQNVRALTKVLRDFDKHKFSTRTIEAHATQFSTPRFHKQIKETVKTALESRI